MPAYPDDFPSRLRAVELTLKQLFTSIQTKPAFDKIEGGRLQIGTSSGARIVLGLSDTGEPELRFYPHSGDNYARVVAGGPGSGIALITDNDVDTKYYEIIQKDSYQVLRLNGSAVQQEGGFTVLGDSFGAHGYFSTSSTSQNYWYHDSGRTILVGNFAAGSAGSTWGIVVGSATTSSGSTGATTSYGPTMASTMNPIVTVQGATANFSWCVTSSSTTGFSTDWSAAGSRTIRYWSYRT